MLESVFKTLGVGMPEGALSLPVHLIVDGRLPIRIFQHKNQWIVGGTIATELSACEENALFLLLERASRMWGNLEGTFCYEKKEDILVLWRNISELKEQEELDPIMSRFLEELEFWRTEAAEVGFTGREIIP